MHSADCAVARSVRLSHAGRYSVVTAQHYPHFYTRMVGLFDGRKILRICSAVSTEYQRVTDGQTDVLRRHSPRDAYASRGKNDHCVSVSGRIYMLFSALQILLF